MCQALGSIFWHHQLFSMDLITVLSWELWVDDGSGSHFLSLGFWTSRSDLACLLAITTLLQDSCFSSDIRDLSDLPALSFPSLRPPALLVRSIFRRDPFLHGIFSPKDVYQLLDRCTETPWPGIQPVPLIKTPLHSTFIDHNPVARLLNEISSSPLYSGVPFADKFPVLSPTHEYLPNLQNRAQILPKPFPVTPSRRDISGLYKELSQIITEKRSRINIYLARLAFYYCLQ